MMNANSIKTLIETINQSLDGKKTKIICVAEIAAGVGLLFVFKGIDMGIPAVLIGQGLRGLFQRQATDKVLQTQLRIEERLNVLKV
jgi:hypothetical protein